MGERFVDIEKAAGPIPAGRTMKTENIEQHTQTEKSREIESFEPERKIFEPRKEYCEGILPLKFEHKFDDGTKLIAEEEKGIATIILKIGNEIIFNFSDLLPEDYKFVTPAFARNTENENLKQQFEEGDIWAITTDEKLVLIGDWQDPRDVITLLHEIGHANQNMEAKKAIEKKLEISANTVFGIKKQNEQSIATAAKTHMKSIREFVSENSKLERGAWAYALNKFREIQKEKDIDLKSIFPSLASLKAFIYPCLKSYRLHHEFRSQLTEDLLNTIPEAREETEKLQKELLNYFDKQKDFDQPSKFV